MTNFMSSKNGISDERRVKNDIAIAFDFTNPFTALINYIKYVIIIYKDGVTEGPA